MRIPELQLTDATNFPKIVAAAQPVIFKNCSLGPCTTLWTTPYLKSTVGADRPVSIHSATSPTMDFQNKNFTYITQPFGTFLDAIDRGERLYLRSLSSSSPSTLPTHLSTDFPTLAPDFSLPPQLASAITPGSTHSSPLRISGPVNMWLHFDIHANVLCQIRGTKRLLLFPPSDVSHLHFAPGASSSSIDVFSPTSSTDLSSTHPHEALLHPGDILFLPPMWSHTAQPTTSTSVAVNVFFRDMVATGYAAGKDVYGNRDLAAYEKGRKDLSRIVKAFDQLPAGVAGFYLERLGMELGGGGREGGRSAAVADGGGSGAKTEVNGSSGENGTGDLHRVYAELG